MKAYLLIYEYDNHPDYDSIIKKAYLNRELADNDCEQCNNSNTDKHAIYYITDVELKIK